MALTQPPPLHPTQFSPEVLDVLVELLGPADRVFDPFAGRGWRLAELCDGVGAVFLGGVDLEQYKGAHPSIRQGNAEHAASYPPEMTTVVTSPVYFGNRISTDYVNGPTPTTKANGRRAYGISLGRALHPDNHARLCRSTHKRAHFDAAARAVEHWPRRVLLNVDLPIAHDWMVVLEGAGYAIVNVDKAYTRRYRGPDNSHKRAEHEVVIEARAVTTCPNDGAPLELGLCGQCGYFEVGDRFVDFVRQPLTSAPWVDSLERRTKRNRPARELRARASSYAHNVGDRSGLVTWIQIMTMLGVARWGPLEHAALLDFDPDDGKTWQQLADIAGLAQADAGAYYRAQRGTWAHAVTEHADRHEATPSELYDEGLRYGFDREYTDALTSAWRALVASCVEILTIETRVVNDTFHAAGTLDRVVRLKRRMRFAGGLELPKGLICVGDVKSSQLRLAAGEPSKYWDDYLSQIYLYATSVPYVMTLDEHGRRCEHRAVWPWEIDAEHGLIAHIDLEGARPVCSWWHADLVAGRELTLLSWGAREFGRRRGLYAAAVVG